MRVIGVYKMLGMQGRPSELLSIEDSYTAFCFDEVCAYILSELQSGKTLIERKDKKQQQTHCYARPSELYSKFKIQ